jgi:hypothetical protein
LRKAAIEIAKHPFFENIALRDFRLAHPHCAAQILALSEDPDSLKLGFRQMNKICDYYKNISPNPSLVQPIQV